LQKAPDYLNELRVKKSLDNRISPKEDNGNKWENIIKRNKFSLLENFEEIKMKAKKLEENAKRKEKIIALKGGVDHNPKLGEDVSNMLIDAIKAKLTILENIK